MQKLRLPTSVAVASLVLSLAAGCDSSDGSAVALAPKKTSERPAKIAHDRPSRRRADIEPAAPEASPPADDVPAAATPSVRTVAKPKTTALPVVDEDRIAAQGIRKVQGARLTLYTDLPANAAIDALPEVFALAVPEWCDYLQLDESQLADWRVRGCLMKDRERFIAAGLLPSELQFANAYTRGNEIWWYDQESDYYRRHLMLHEGTHSLMFARFGSCGPPWYMEALAELLGTHHLGDGKLTLGYFPSDPETVPYWGRLRIVRDAVRSGPALSVAEVLAYPPDSYLRNETYGWCWAIAAFLDGHPRYRERFRRLPGELRSGDFNRQFRALFANDWQALSVEWLAFIHELDYGYDFVRNAIDFRPGRPLGTPGETVTLAADRGWQSTGLRLEAGVDYELTATGRYQVANEPRIWWCEPGGVTIRYYRGRPLGMLLAMVLPDDAAVGDTRWPEPVGIGLGGTLAAEKSGTLYLRINDSPAELADNAGSLEVSVRAGQDRPSP